jgi:isoquinoline 1-oxidoreductase beta subunit
MTIKLNRRGFLQVSAAAGAGLVIGFYIPWTREVSAQEPSKPNPFNAWVRIDRDGHVTLIVAKSEMGQGVRTSLPMILAEELEVDWSSVRVEQAPTRPDIYPDLGTGGSSSVRTSWLPLRRAGAAARDMLIAAAAQTWGVGQETCYAEKGAVIHRPTARRLAYGKLVEAAAKLPIPDLASVPLKKSEQFRIVGTSIPRTDTPAKVDGSAVFGLDVKVPGMLYAVVARCPTFGGKAKRVDATKAKAVSGVREVVEIPAHQGAHSAGGVAVVADSTWAAIQGRDALEIEWDHGPHANETSQSLRQQFESLAQKPGKVIRNDGDAPAKLEGATKKVEAVYELPFLAHATMEPMNCTADVRADRAEVWAPAQGPEWVLGAVAEVAQLPPRSVVVHTLLMGGGFGRRYHADFAVEATQISKAVGKPVKVVWTRDDDMQHDFYRPASYHRLSGTVDEQGRVSAWMHRILSPSIAAFWGWGGGAKPELSEVSGAADLAYAIPNIRVEYAQAETGVPVAWWRSVEHSFTAFAVECFIDELAAAARLDPVTFRRRLLQEPRQVPNPVSPESVLDTRRLKGVLELAAEKAGWGKPLRQGRARGIACHFSFSTYVAQVAEVSVGKTGAVRVHRVVCAVDCGQPINPDGVKAQMESGIVYGLTAALKGEIAIKDGRVEQSNFHDYEMLRINQMPVIEVHIVPSTEAPTGTGEPGLPPIAPAVANAIFAATGQRIRRLPIRTEDSRKA